MSKIKRVIVTITLLLFFSCNNGIIHEEKTFEKSETELVLEIISAMGFDTEGYQIIGDDIIVEGDIAINLKGVLSDSSRQYFSNYFGLVSDNNVANVKLTHSLGSSWNNAFNAAINEWNSIPNTKIRLKGTDYYGRSYSASEADIDIYYDADAFKGGPANVLGRGQMAHNNHPGTYININLGHSDMRYYTDSQKKFILMHEIGHCLGFMHMNTPPGDDDQHIHGTPTYASDTRSIMSYSFDSSYYYTTAKFTNGDIIAAQNLYPKTADTPYIDVYEHTAFSGINYRLYESCDLLPFNDTLSSIKLYNGAHIWVYEHWRYTGKRYGYYTPTVDYIYNISFNDRASSIQFSAWQEVGEVILNKTFSNSGDWDQSSLYHYRTPDKLYTSNFKITDKCEAYVSNGVLHTYISDRGSNPEDIYFKTTDLQLDNRFLYEVSFKARTENGQNRYIKVAIGEGLMDNTYEENEYKITEDFSTFSFRFSPDSYTSNGTLAFYMGDMPKDLWSKDVVLDDLKIKRYR